MANICENTLRVSSESVENLDYIAKFFKSIGDVNEFSAETLDIYFDSKWRFPEELMNDLYNNLPNKNDIDMTCLSVEWGCYYCQFHTCDENGWSEEP